MRQAIRYAIDRVSILQNIYHIPDPTPLNCIYLNPDFNPPDVATYTYDPAKAKQLLADAGVDPATWGEIVFDTYYQDQGSLAAMTAIQANLADVGIKVKIQQMDSASWTDRYYGKGNAADGTSQMSMIGGDGGPRVRRLRRHARDYQERLSRGRQRLERLSTANPEMDAALTRSPPSSTPRRSVTAAPGGLPHRRRGADLHQPLGHDALLVRQQPDRQLRQHPRPGHGQLLQGR